MGGGGRGGVSGAAPRSHRASGEEAAAVRTAFSAGRALSPPRSHRRTQRSHLSSLLSPARGHRGVMRPRRAAAPAVSAGS